MSNGYGFKYIAAILGLALGVAVTTFADDPGFPAPTGDPAFVPAGAKLERLFDGGCMLTEGVAAGHDGIDGPGVVVPAPRRRWRSVGRRTPGRLSARRQQRVFPVLHCQRRQCGDSPNLEWLDAACRGPGNDHSNEVIRLRPATASQGGTK